MLLTLEVDETEAYFARFLAADRSAVWAEPLPVSGTPACSRPAFDTGRLEYTQLP
jgi:hypothetical protein